MTVGATVFYPGTLTPLQIAQTAYSAGFRGKTLAEIVATVIAESGGNPNALNDNPHTGDYSVGLAQINYFGGLKDVRTKLFGPPDALKDPLANLKAAFIVSGQGTNLNPWSTYKSGAYRSYLPAALTAAAAVDPTVTSPQDPPVGAPTIPTPSTVAGGSPTGAGPTVTQVGISNPLGAVGSSIGNLIARAALYTVFVAAGFGLVVLGLARLTGSHPIPIPIPV